MNMKINNIFTQNLNFQQNIQQNNIFNKSANASKPVANNLSALDKDTFCPAFKGGEANIIRFSKLLDEAVKSPQKANILGNPNAMMKEFSDLFNKVFNYVTKAPENFIGNGRWNNAYIIDRNYVLRTSRELASTKIKANDIEIVDNAQIKHLKTYFGAKLVECLEGNITILKNANPDKNAIVLGKPYEKDYGESPVEENFKKSVKKLATTPQSAYDKVAEDMNNLDYLMPAMFFDYMNPNNFLVVKNGIENEIRVVDDIGKNDYCGRNTLSSLLKVFLTNEQVRTPAYFDSTLVKARKEIFKKCIMSGEKHDLDIYDYDMDNVITSSLQLAKYKDNQTLLKQLKILRKEYPSSNQRLSAVKELLDNLN